MACRCVTVGYHGNGGREYFTPDHGFPIPFGDILPFARAVEHVLHTLDADPAAFNELTSRASQFIRSNYTSENEQRDVRACWSRILSNISREPLPAAVVA